MSSLWEPWDSRRLFLEFTAASIPSVHFIALATAGHAPTRTRLVMGATSPADICRQLGVSEATFYIWKKKYAHLGVSELRKLRSLEDENARLKRLVADLSLDKHILTEALRKKD